MTTETDTLTATLGGLLESALEAMSQAILLSAEGCAADGIEYIANYMNNTDATAGDDPEVFQKWVDRGRP